MNTTTTDELRGVVEYVHRNGEHLEVKIARSDVAVFLSPIKGGGDFDAGDTIAIHKTGDSDWSVEILARAATQSVLPDAQDQSVDEGRR